MKYIACCLLSLLLFSCAKKRVSYDRSRTVCATYKYNSKRWEAKVRVKEFVLERIHFSYYGDKTIEIECDKHGKPATGKIYYDNEMLCAEFSSKHPGEADSFYHEYYPNGILKMEGAVFDSTPFKYIYLGNYRNGKFTGYDSAGNLAYIEYWRDGEPYGKYKAWHSNGKIKLEGQFGEEGMTGLWKFYDTLGRRIKTRKYPLHPWNGLREAKFDFVVMQEAVIGRTHIEEAKKLAEEIIDELGGDELYNLKHKYGDLYLMVNEGGITSLVEKKNQSFYAIKPLAKLRSSPAELYGRPARVFYKINYRIEDEY